MVIPKRTKTVINFNSRRTAGSSFTITSTKQRIITTSILLGLVATVLPYQFAYLVLCIVQIVTAIRALRLLRDTVSLLLYCLVHLLTSLSALITCIIFTTIRIPFSYSCSGFYLSIYQSWSSGFETLPFTG